MDIVVVLVLSVEEVAVHMVRHAVTINVSRSTTRNVDVHVSRMELVWQDVLVLKDMIMSMEDVVRTISPFVALLAVQFHRLATADNAILQLTVHVDLML